MAFLLQQPTLRQEGTGKVLRLEPGDVKCIMFKKKRISREVIPFPHQLVKVIHESVMTMSPQSREVKPVPELHRTEVRVM